LPRVGRSRAIHHLLHRRNDPKPHKKKTTHKKTEMNDVWLVFCAVLFLWLGVFILAILLAGY
jgi:Trk-type K+ transport system membrane component